jgi:hypothetical protein
VRRARLGAGLPGAVSGTGADEFVTAPLAGLLVRIVRHPPRAMLSAPLTMPSPMRR